ncbi:hypothetical protein BaRGS_00021337 [Batillaria attramentaria]|uniref:Uncharacterized protein n=1 Tax=Batillaria attramentaria TaxID=370345 RepID=A0ABD0KKP7_9CAEN
MEIRSPPLPHPTKNTRGRRRRPPAELAKPPGATWCIAKRRGRIKSCFRATRHICMTKAGATDRHDRGQTTSRVYFIPACSRLVLLPRLLQLSTCVASQLSAAAG